MIFSLFIYLLVPWLVLFPFKIIWFFLFYYLNYLLLDIETFLFICSDTVQINSFNLFYEFCHLNFSTSVSMPPPIQVKLLLHIKPSLIEKDKILTKFSQRQPNLKNFQQLIIIFLKRKIFFRSDSILGQS